MKDIWFYIPRILAVVVMIAILSLIGIGNPIMIPIYAGFFILVFGLIYFANRQASKNRDGAGTGGTLRLVLQLVGTVIFIGVFSLIGLINSPVWIAVWAVVLVAIFLLVFLTIHRRQRHSEYVPSNPIYRKIAGVLLALLALILPLLIVWRGGFILLPEAKIALAVLAALAGIVVYIALTLIAVMLINRQGSDLVKQALGYLIIVAAAVLPGLLVITVDKTSTAVAGAYFSALVALIIAFYAQAMILSKEGR
jgi:hypothetical protein